VRRRGGQHLRLAQGQLFVESLVGVDLDAQFVRLLSPLVSEADSAAQRAALGIIEDELTRFKA
jgi:hypothetical protein